MDRRRGGSGGGGGGGYGKKRKKQQPNLQRASRALSRLVSEGYSEGSSANSEPPKQSKKRKLSRKEERKKERQNKKSRKATPKRAKPITVVEQEPIKADVPSHKQKSVSFETTSKEPKKIKVKVSKTKESNNEDENIKDQGNPLFLAMMKKSGLLGDEAEEEEDEDDKIIREMEKRMKLKKGAMKDEGDGLESIFNYKEDARTDMLKDQDYDSENFEDEDADDDGLGDILGGLGGSDAEGDDFNMSKLTAADIEIDGDYSDLDGLEDDDEVDVGVDDDDDDDDDADDNGDEDDDDNDDDDDDDGQGSDNDNDEVDSDADLSDNEDAIEKAKIEKNTQYISRQDAYGDQTSGLTETGKAMTTTTRYVPPGKRDSVMNKNEKTLRLQRQVKGLLNRVNESNLVVIMKDVENAYQSSSRNEISTIITTFVLDACVNRESTLDHLLMVYAACITSLHHVVGIEVTAHFLRDLVAQFDINYKKYVIALEKLDEGAVHVDKQCTNLLTILCHMYNFKIVHSVTIGDLLRRCIKTFNDLDVELILVVLNGCGRKLRADDATMLTELLQEVGDRAKDLEPKPRIRFMLESIADLKNNRKKLVKETPLAFQNLTKAVRSFVTGRHAQSHDPLRVPWADLLDADAKGRWWLVGSAWAGKGNNAAGINSSNNKKDDTSISNGSDTVSEAILQAASKQRMNTEARKQIFCIIMGSEDYLEAFEKLVKLKLVGKQDREILRVLVDCCLQEKTYNPYYAVLGEKLCHHNHNHKFTLQFALWDRFKDLESLTVVQVSNLTKLLSHFIVKHSLSMAMLKVVQFSSLQGRGQLFFQLLLVNLLTYYSQDETDKMFERIAPIKDLQPLKLALLLFLKHYVRGFKLGVGSGGAKTPLKQTAKEALLKERLKLAKGWLSRSSDGLQYDET